MLDSAMQMCLLQFNSVFFKQNSLVPSTTLNQVQLLHRKSGSGILRDYLYVLDWQGYVLTDTHTCPLTIATKVRNFSRNMKNSRDCLQFPSVIAPRCPLQAVQETFEYYC